MKYSVLICGLSGISGWHLFQFFRQKPSTLTIGICSPKENKLRHKNIFPIEADDFEKIEKLWKKYHFNTVIDSFGCCALKSCEYNPKLSYRINVDASYFLALLCKKYQTKLFRLSSDLVFDGVGTGSYLETSKPNPVTVYGKHMLMAEEKILAVNPTSTIFRISLPMGNSVSGHTGAIDWITSRFKQGKFATLYYDEIRSNIYASDIVKTIDYFVENFTVCPTGLLHLGGPKKMSLYQIAQIINVVGNYPPNLLKGCYRSEDKSIIPRAGNVSMDSKKIYSYLPCGWINPWPMNHKLTPTGWDWHYSEKRPIISQIT